MREAYISIVLHVPFPLESLSNKFVRKDKLTYFKTTFHKKMKINLDKNL